MNQERHDNCWVMRGAIFAFFALCLLLFLTLLASRHSDSTPDNYCCLFPMLCVFLWMYRPISVVSFSWTRTGQEWTWCCSRMDTSVRVFSLSVFFVVVCTIFICAVFLWAPKHLCDHGLDLGDQLMWEINPIKSNQSISNTLKVSIILMDCCIGIIIPSHYCQGKPYTSVSYFIIMFILSPSTTAHMLHAYQSVEAI